MVTPPKLEQVVEGLHLLRRSQDIGRATRKNSRPEVHLVSAVDELAAHASLKPDGVLAGAKGVDVAGPPA